MGAASYRPEVRPRTDRCLTRHSSPAARAGELCLLASVDPELCQPVKLGWLVTACAGADVAAAGAGLAATGQGGPPEAVEWLRATEQPEATEPLSAMASPDATAPLVAWPLPDATDVLSPKALPDEVGDA